MEITFSLGLFSSCRAKARDPGVETDSTEDQPRQPRGDCCQVSSHAEGSQPGEPPAQEAPHLPEVLCKLHCGDKSSQATFMLPSFASIFGLLDIVE